MEQAIGDFNRTKGKVVDDFNAVVNDADELLQKTSEAASDGYNVTRAKFSEKLRNAKTNVMDAQRVVTDKAKQAMTVTDDYVNGNPWAAVGIAAGIGLFIGFLAGKR